MLKIRIELIDDASEEEVLIRCGQVDERIQAIQKFILEGSFSKTKMTFYKQNKEFYFPLEHVLFFETDGEHIYAHTVNDNYRIKYRLYELDEILPQSFVRASKSAIVNIKQVYAITRNLTASSLIQFKGSHKNVYASRHYFNVLRERLNGRSSYEK